MEAGCQELLAFSEQACFVVISTSTPTEDILALGPLSFRGLLSKLQHVAINVVGENQAHLGQLFMLIRHKHSDPYKKDYAAEHYMSCLPAEGVRNHTFDTSARVWAAYLRQLRSPGPSNVGDATDAASGSAASADLAAKPEAVSALSPAKLIQDVHPGTAQQQQQQQAESGSMAQEGTTPNQQSLPALLAISATPGAGPATAQQANPQDAELPVLPRPVPAGVTSAVQLPVTPGAAVQKEGGSRLDTSPGTHKPAVQTSLDESLLHEDSHSLPSGTSSGLTSEQGTPKGNK